MISASSVLFRGVHFVISDFQVSAELPMDSDEADEEKKKGCPVVLYVFGRGSVPSTSPWVGYQHVTLGRFPSHPLVICIFSGCRGHALSSHPLTIFHESMPSRRQHVCFRFTRFA
jgi:hypothetical protein